MPTSCNATGFSDEDGDGIHDCADICVGVDTVDSDSDGVPDDCDVCAGSPDSEDDDSDGVPNACDNCPTVYNPTQADSDMDGIGDACECAPTVICDDGNPCTDQVCDSAVGCVYMNNTFFCSDMNACTVGDACVNGVCVPGPALSCDDANPCTDDSCDMGTGCVNADNLLPCDDENECTIGDACSGGACTGAGMLNCDDGNGCTEDSCDQMLGCQYANNRAACDDGDACTVNDVCGVGICVGTSVDPQSYCDDANACTDDDCDSLVGCTHANNAVACDDGNACTNDDQCTNGACSGAPPPPWGDVHPVGAPNGIVNLDDILCVLAAFANSELCPDADLKPCGGDGLYNVDDILGVLTAFSGVNQCPCMP